MHSVTVKAKNRRTFASLNFFTTHFLPYGFLETSVPIAPILAPLGENRLFTLFHPSKRKKSKEIDFLPGLMHFLCIASLQCFAINMTLSIYEKNWNADTIVSVYNGYYRVLITDTKGG